MLRSIQLILAHSGWRNQQIGILQQGGLCCRSINCFKYHYSKTTVKLPDYYDTIELDERVCLL
jgi:hypothetical protein